VQKTAYGKVLLRLDLLHSPGHVAEHIVKRLHRSGLHTVQYVARHKNNTLAAIGQSRSASVSAAASERMRTLIARRS